MGSIGAGLIAFAIGETATAASGAAAAGTAKLSDGVKLFTEGKSNAQRVKDEVEIYLSIADKPFGQMAGDIGKFATVMGGISLGLAAFAGAEGAAAITGFLGNMSAGEDGSQAERIKKQVDILLSIGEGKNLENAGKAGTAMKDLGAGLGEFAKGEFVGSIASVGSAIAGFFAEGPFEKVLELSDKAEDLTKAGNAIGAVAKNLQKVVAIKVDKDAMDIKKFAENLKEAVPIIEGAIFGTTEGGLFGIGSTTIEGLANKSFAYAAAKDNLFMLRSALNPEGAGGASAQSADSMSIAATSVVVSGPITASGNITATGPITAEGGGIAPGAPGAAEGTSNFNATKDAETVE